jgi:hypothetical protein|tara:strand:- start:1141 stop:1788 length:648 start_codon:yes stop_codon:yes gene_type:complete
MSFTFATLKTAIQDYTENNESTFVTHLPDFIKTAEERILKNVQLSLFRKNQSGSATQNDRFLAVPSDFLAPFSLSVTSSSEHVFLDFKDTNFVQTYNPDSSNTGVPRYYAVFDINNFILGPTPNANFSVELHYYYRPTSLTAGADGGTTWLSENAPNCMLYGALIEAYVFMKGEQDMMAMYDKRFTEALVGLKQFGEAKETTDQYQTGMVIRPKQ